MANEISYSYALSLYKAGASGAPPLINYRQTRTYQDTLNGSRGPTPGAVMVTKDGVIVSTAELAAQGGWCEFINKDGSNFVTLGIWIASLSRFDPIADIPPGLGFAMKLSRYLTQSFAGTGTAPGPAASLRLKAAPGTPSPGCEVIVNAFDQ